MSSEVYTNSGAIGDTVIVATNWECFNNFVSVKYYDSDPAITGANEVIPGAGTITLSASIIANNKYVDLTDNVLDCTDITDYTTFMGGANTVRAVPSGITTATHYLLKVVQSN